MNPKVLLYWVLVAFPLSWGLYQSYVKAKPIFDGSLNKKSVPPAAVAPATPAAAPTAVPTPAATPATSPSASPSS